MPIFEFKCRDCGAVTERLVLLANDGEFCICNNCGGNRTERIMSMPALRNARRGLGEPVTVPASGRRCQDRSGSAAGNWPGNDDFIRIKGQQ